MSKILFTHSYFYRFDPKQWKAAQPYPPYGTMCAAAVMRDCGYAVKIFDTALRKSPAELLPVLEKERPDYLVIYDDGFNYLTKMCLTRMREAAFEMAKMGKAQGCTVIVSSSDSTDHYEEYLRQGADFVILGEGEITLRELIVTVDGGRWRVDGRRQTTDGRADFSAIPGIAYSISDWRFRIADYSGVNPQSEIPNPKSEIRNPPRPVLHDLDSLPDPAWDLIDVESYRQIWMRHHGYFCLNLATTRGCPFKCNWCAKPIYGNRYNSRSPERVAAEIEMLIGRHGVRHFWMADDIFGLKPGWVQRFRDIVREKNLKFQYKIQSRVDLLLKEDTIDALAASGLRQVWVGAESGSQKILDAMDKGTTVEEIREATKLLKKKGIEVCFFLQFGYLGETKEDIEATLNMVEELMPHDIGVSVSYPLPGTKFHEKVKNLLGEKQNWTVSDDLAMMYPATYPPAFYRRLHRLVHKRFRLQQGLEAWRKIWEFGKPDAIRAARLLYYAPAAWLDAWRLKRLEQINPDAMPFQTAR
ncbi:MAG: radical SAM protein [Haliscomenobacteraceae bacterium CHB4]|nr:Anaerobic magnesium-protoporphyrin IX monomethyl ester cyclase [Saprospiraceae bacterium]MCE7923275.1 radical SAM protein [Haliscomenobacteraceae bacterium CHB4]